MQHDLFLTLLQSCFLQFQQNPAIAKYLYFQHQLQYSSHHFPAWQHQYTLSTDNMFPLCTNPAQNFYILCNFIHSLFQQVSVSTSSSIMDQNTTNSTKEHCGLSEMPARPFFITVYAVIFVASLMLNSIAIYVYLFKVTTQSSITVYLKNLAIADLFVCLCLILRIFKYASASVGIQSIYCKFGAPASYFNMYSSILFMGYIAANRYGCLND